MENLEKVRTIRKAKRKYLSEVQNDSDKLSKSSDPAQEAHLGRRLVKLQQRLEDINKVYEGIPTILKDEIEIEHEIRDAAQFRDFMYDTVVTTELILKRFESKTMQPKTDVTVAPSFSTKIKLPTVALKRFDGDPCNWQTFWESFCSVVHKVESLPDIMRFHHFKSLLGGKAAATIGEHSVSGSTYKEAIRKSLRTEG